MIKFTIYGNPVPQARPRFRNIKTKAGQNINIAYEPAESRDYKSWVKSVALRYRPPQPLETAVNLGVKVYRSIPASWSQKKQTQAIENTIRPISKPDLDNYIKGVSDALNGIIWRDDSQVVSFDGSGKYYGDTPRIEITISKL